MDLSEKIKIIRFNERLKQTEMAEMVGISLPTLKSYETGVRKAASTVEIFKILNHPRFNKYLLWFVTGTAKLPTKQVEPFLGHGD